MPRATVTVARGGIVRGAMRSLRVSRLKAARLSLAKADAVRVVIAIGDAIATVDRGMGARVVVRLGRRKLVPAITMSHGLRRMMP
jgi:hypothetical protein